MFVVYPLFYRLHVNKAILEGTERPAAVEMTSDRRRYDVMTPHLRQFVRRVVPDGYQVHFMDLFLFSKLQGNNIMRIRPKEKKNGLTVVIITEDNQAMS